MDAEGALRVDAFRFNESARILPRLYDLSLSTLAVLIFGAFVSTTSGQNLACNVGSLEAWPVNA